MLSNRRPIKLAVFITLVLVGTGIVLPSQPAQALCGTCGDTAAGVACVATGWSNGFQFCNDHEFCLRLLTVWNEQLQAYEVKTIIVRCCKAWANCARGAV